MIAYFACSADLLRVVERVRGELSTLQRATHSALVVLDVHARDVAAQLAENGVASDRDFDWQAQLRSYWVDDDGERGKTVQLQMMSAAQNYGHAPRPVPPAPEPAFSTFRFV